MLTYTTLTPRALEIVCEGHVTAADAREAFARIERLIEVAPKLDILADVRAGVHIEFGAVIEELKYLGLFRRLAGVLDRFALLADPAWIRAAGRIESHLVPHVDYRVFERDRAAEARSWILREDETSPPAA
jgi:hypothetical protein